MQFTKKESLTCFFGTLSILITYPIWYYLLYKILQYVQATDLMWFLYWVYVPVTLVISVASEFITKHMKDEK
jgi:hypothetical protein